MSGLEELDFVKPADIEGRSFEIISRELGERGVELDPENELVVKRVIHTSADFDYAGTLVFSEHATTRGIEALASGCSVVTDTKMALAGINKRVLGRFGGEVLNFIADDETRERAKAAGLTRSAVSMERAAELGEPLVYAIGNAPTALVRIYELLHEGKMPKPALVVGVPVGFVNVVESKELVIEAGDELGVPYIVARGRKGGSNVAAAIVNALLYQASGNARE